MNPYLLVFCISIAVLCIAGILICEFGSKWDNGRREGCLLCEKYSSKIFESKRFFVILDDFPVRKGHLLLIPRRHIEDLTDLSRAEFRDLHDVLQRMMKYLEVHFQADGYNLGVNCGEAAGQTERHLHIHVIPRRLGDVPNPRGGIRKFLPNPVKEYPQERDGL